MSNLLLDYFFKMVAINPTPAASTAFLKQVCLVVAPKSGVMVRIPTLCTSNSQVAALTAIRSRIYERNGELLARYDSIRKDYRPPKAQDRNRTGSTPETDSVRIASLNQMRTLRQLIDSISTRRTADVRDVLDYLTDDKQHKAAVELLNDQDRDFSDKLPRMLDGRGGRRGGGDPPG